MGKHKEWRKIAKKTRRKRIRRKLALKREALEREEKEKLENSPSYIKRQAEEAERLRLLEEAEREESEKLNKKWEQEEKRVREQTILRQTLLKELEEIKESKRIEKEESLKRKIEAKKQKEEERNDYIYRYALGQISALPVEMIIPSETHPGKEECEFFRKVGACRFWDSCSRNHIKPALSKTLLFPGFYSHFTIAHLGEGEYDTDMSLEYDDKETYSHFLEFYNDIRAEFESFGRLTNLVVCCNQEIHLRGNVYASYVSEREAMLVYLKFNGRYYGGKRITCHFASIPSWKNAICGLFFKKRCQKGNACNFLHIFKDPGPPFHEIPQNQNSFSRHSPGRWSESPEWRSNDDSNSGIAENRSPSFSSEREGNRRRRSRSLQKRRSISRERRSSRSPDRSNRYSKDRKRKRRQSERSPDIKNHSSERQSYSNRRKNRSRSPSHGKKLSRRSRSRSSSNRHTSSRRSRKSSSDSDEN